MLILFTAITYPYGVRKHIRQEKARIRREFSDFEDRKHHIEKLYLKFNRQDKKIEETEKSLKSKKVEIKKKIPKIVKKNKTKISKKKREKKTLK